MATARFRSVMRVSFVLLTAAGAAPAFAQHQASPAEQPYKPLAVTMPAEFKDAAFDALRGQIAEAAKRRDRAALARLVTARPFFWEREGGNAAGKRKPGIDILSVALGLANKDSVGWDMLTAYAEDPTASPSSHHKGAMCAPAEPGFNNAEFDRLLKATGTAVTDWGYPVSAGIEVHATPQANGAVVDKLGLHFVRVAPEAKPVSAAYLRVLTPSGKAGYVSVDTIAPIGNDRLCYIKDGDGWKIGGYVGAGESQ